MKMAPKTIAALGMVSLFSWGCAASSDAQYVRQRIPIEIRSGTPAVVRIHSLSGNGWNEVGIRCSPDVLKTLLGGKDKLGLRLLSSSKNGTEIVNASPDDHKLWPVDSFHYLFAVGGAYRAEATVEIMFPTAPEGVTKAEIIVLKTPSDTGL